jgi:hypothetical protein
MMRFSEFYGPERQRELLAEAEHRRLGQAATGNRQPWLISLKGENIMYRKIVIALIVVGSLIIGYSSLAQASHNCNSDSTVSAANPELNVSCKNDVIAGNESATLRAVEASAARYNAMAEYYAANSTTRAIEASAARYTGLAEYYAANSATRAIEASAARYTGLAGYYTAAKGTAGSTFLAANPELMAYNRYTVEQEWHRMHFPGR